MKKVLVFGLGLFFVCFIVLVGGLQAADKITKLEFASYAPATEGVSVALQEWCKEVEKRTNGRVTVTFHPGATLVAMPQTYEAVANGIVDIGFAAFGYTPGRFPMMELLRFAHWAENIRTGCQACEGLHREIQTKGTSGRKTSICYCDHPGADSYQKADPKT